MAFPAEIRRYRVRQPHETPPGGWVWKRGDALLTDRENFFALEGRVQAHLIQAGEDPAVAADEIHHCTALHLIAIGQSKRVEVIGDVRRTGEQYRSGAKAAFLTWWKQSPIAGLLRGKIDRGEPVFVAQAEADRRAAICANCPHNVTPAAKSWAQKWTDGGMLAAVEDRKTAHHDRLAVCQVCSCELRAAVWWLPDILIASMKGKRFPLKFPAICWKAKLHQIP